MRPFAVDPAAEDDREATARPLEREPEEDPVLAAIRRAPPISPEVQALCRKLWDEVTSDPRTWTLTTEQLLASHPEAVHVGKRRAPR